MKIENLKSTLVRHRHDFGDDTPRDKTTPWGPVRSHADPSQYADGPFHVQTRDEDLGAYKAIYFINASDELLSQVQYSTGGFTTPDPDVVVPVSGAIRTYENVAPGEAVRFDFYEEVFDSDYVLEYYFAIVKSDGTREELGPILCSKGLAPNAVLGAQGRQFLTRKFFSGCPEHILPKPYRGTTDTEE